MRARFRPMSQSDQEEGSRRAQDGGPPQRRVRSFALRRGHVTNAQRRAYDELFPRVAIPYAPAELDFVQAFGRGAPSVLEIGFGMGETTASIAARRPDVNFLVVEVFLAGIG